MPTRFLQQIIGWVCILCIIGMSGFAMPGWAQDFPLDPRPANLEPLLLKRPNLDSSNIPSEKVSQFVQACLQVITLIERREVDLQSATTEAEASRIEQEIEAAAIAVIERNGLTRQEYLQLLGLANTDPEFGERVAIQLQETN